jgi:dihydrodiol dehydrogenase / D-xylose 1-dehydrogenase (NADP)
MLALQAGKNVLCEKAFTVNAAQAKKLVETAKEKGLFLMEAVWTRYFPLSIYVRDTVASGKIGTVYRVTADNGFAMDPENEFADGKSRMVNPDLAGGALLDLGIYSLTWLFQTLYTVQDPQSRQKPEVLAAQKLYNAEPVKGGADETSTVLLRFPRSEKQGGDAHGVAMTSIRIAADPAGGDEHTIPTIRISGSKGEIQVYPPAFRPTRTRLIISKGDNGKPHVEDKQWPQPGPGKGSGWKNGFGSDWNEEGEGHGMFWEADEAARALVKGAKESSILTWEESITIMETMDKVREMGGLKYPEKIETTQYPVSL